MKPAPFRYHRTNSVADVVDLLGAFGDDEVKLIAGGQSLIPLMNFRLARPDHLIDISAVPELLRVERTADGIDIGAMVRQRDLVVDSLLRYELPLMAEAVAHVGHGHIRNRGTLGGSLAHADPAAELPVVLVALDASIYVEGANGRRRIAAEDFFTGWFSTGLADDELLTNVVIAPMTALDPGGTVEWGFEELARRQGDFAMVLAATILWRDRAGMITDARVVAGGVGAAPVRCRAAEAALQGTLGGAVAIAEAAGAARDCVDPSDDVHATALYRSEMVEVLAKRCLSNPRTLQPLADTTETLVDLDEQLVTRPIEPDEGDQRTGTATVNGEIRSLVEVADRRLLADWLRDDLGLTGTHLGCEHGVCGACTVLLDGEPVRSCLTLARQVEGRAITTIEDLGTPVTLHPVQEAFRVHHGLQCGFCTPGMVLTALDLLARIPDPTEAQVRQELSGNICRCTGYVKIVQAVMSAAEVLRADDACETKDADE